MAEKEDRDGRDSGSEKVRLNLWINRMQYNELKMLADYEGRTVSDIVRQVLNSHLRDNSDSVERQRTRKKG